jgi:DNA polymerase (family X)
MSADPRITTRDVLAMLDEMARLTILAEGSPQSFKVRAYENAIHGIEAAGADVTSLDPAELERIKGVGRSIAEKIRELVETGTVEKLEHLRAEYPPAFVELSRIPGLGPKSLSRLRRELGIETLDDLRRALDAHALRELPGFGAASEDKIARAVERLGMHGKDRRTPIGDALPVAEAMVERLSAVPGVVEARWCGSLRRFAETIGDVDVVVAADGGAPVMSEVRGHPAVDEVILSGDTKTSILTREGLQVDVRVVEPGQIGAALLYFTGSKAHNIALRRRAIDRGLLLNEYGLFVAGTDEPVAQAGEEDIYRALGLAFIPPELREDEGEIEAAAEGRLPDLVTLDAIRGDLHDHTVRSGDGRSTLDEMVRAAIARGHEYLAITDHGEDLSINGSTWEEMLAHRDAIRRIQEEHPGIGLLWGCELNIGPEGSLDYDLERRMELEWCVASVHSHFDLPRVEQTRRLVAAIADPSVHVIGHLTGRYLGRRPGIEIDVDAVLDALAEHGVALEVNAALQRLDAPAEVVRRAVAKGVDLAISTDAHHTTELARMAYGVATARRGWAPGSAVLNARGRDHLLAWARRRR